jgi:hypothetical protein
MLDAISFVMGAHAGHYFTLTEDSQSVRDDIGGIEAGEVTPDIASTLTDYAMDCEGVVGVSVDSECHFGSVLAHYADDGKIIRFVAIR